MLTTCWKFVPLTLRQLFCIFGCDRGVRAGPPAVGAGQGLVSVPQVPPPACACGRRMRPVRGGGGAVFCCAGLGGWSRLLRPQTAFGDERSTSQGSQPPPPGSPLPREEGEAPPLAPAEEGRRRSRRVRLRGSCRHRPSLLSRRELTSSGPAVPAAASSEVSRPGTMGEGFVGPGAAVWPGLSTVRASEGWGCHAAGHLWLVGHQWASEESVSRHRLKSWSAPEYWGERAVCRAKQLPLIGSVTLAGPQPWTLSVKWD